MFADVARLTWGAHGSTRTVLRNAMVALLQYMDHDEEHKCVKELNREWEADSPYIENNIVYTLDNERKTRNFYKIVANHEDKDSDLFYAQKFVVGDYLCTYPPRDCSLTDVGIVRIVRLKDQRVTLAWNGVHGKAVSRRLDNGTTCLFSIPHGDAYMYN